MSTHTVTINGIDLVYEKDGTGPPLVFLHGGNASAVWWEHVIPYVMDKFTCFRLEQRGHGRSGRAPDGDYRYSSMVDETIGFMDQVTGQAILVGQSQGGVVAMGVAAKRPDLARGVFLEDSVPAMYARSNTVPVSTSLSITGVLTRVRGL